MATMEEVTHIWELCGPCLSQSLRATRTRRPTLPVGI